MMKIQPNLDVSSFKPSYRLFLRLQLLMFIKILFDQCVPFLREKLSRWLLKDRECFETARQAFNLSSLHAPTSTGTGFTATTNTNGCNSAAFSKVLHTCKMDQ